MTLKRLVCAIEIVCIFSLEACSAKQHDEYDKLGANALPVSFSALLEQYGKLTDPQRMDALEAIQSAGNTSPADRQQAAYMLARLLQKSANIKDVQRAIQLYQTASDQAALWERCRLHIAECAAVTGQEKTARAALAELISARETALSVRAGAQYALAQSYLRAGEKENARSGFEAVRRQFPKTQYAVGALYYLGVIALSGKTAADNDAGTTGGASGSALSNKALNYFRTYLTISPDGHFAADIVQQLQTAPQFVPTARDHGLFAQVFYRQAKFKEALDHYTQSKSDAHFVEQATCRLKLSDAAGAKRVLAAGIYAHPSAPSVVPAAQLYSRLCNRADALKIWQIVLKFSPRYADVALWNLSERQQDAPHAVPLYRTLVYKYPDSKFAPDSAWWLIWYQSSPQMNKAAPTAISQLRLALKRYGRSKAAPRFAFWIGKFEEASHQSSRAAQSYLWTIRQFPSNYYAWRARARLAALSNGGGDPGWETTPLGPCGCPTWSWPDEPNQIKFEDVQNKCGYTVAVLTMLKQWDEALQIMQPPDPLISAWCLANQNLPLKAINAASSGISGPPRRDARWQFAYPLLYGKLISTNAQSKHVDPCLIHALIREESRYYSRAVSCSNALGLMQLLPSTAAITASHCGVALCDMHDCFIPEKNVRLGTQYFAELLQRFKGNALFAVAAYNGGPGAIAKARYSNDLDVFVENIPFDETRDYIRKVFDSYWNYKQIYG